jgi:hypothetical protein
MNVEIGAEDALFPEKEYITKIAVAVLIGIFFSASHCNVYAKCIK